jgi:signal transduction histidine kinase/ligand-binding sensor domain-containing protein
VLTALLPDAALALDPARDLRQYKHTRWTATEGAPQSIYALAQGADGYLWIGSAEGVFRFDGVSFEPISLKVPRLRRVRATALLAARDGTIWVGYEDGAIATYRNGELRLETSPPKTDAFTMRFAQTSDGVIWVAAGRKGRALLRYADGRWQEVGAPWGLPEEWLVDVTATRDGSLWVTTIKEILQLRKGSIRFKRVGTTNGHAAVSEDPRGRIWLSDDRGTRILTAASTEDRIPTPGASRAVNTGFDRDGNLWGINGEGIYRMRAPTAWSERSARARVERYNAKDGLSSDFSLSYLEDHEGNIWIGSSLGLDRFRTANVVVEPHIGSKGKWGYALLRALDGSVYVGASDGLFRIRPGGRPRPVSGAGAETMDICEGPDGSIWAIQSTQALRIRANGLERIPIPSDSEWQDCAVHQDGSLILGGQGGLRIFKSGRWRHRPLARAGEATHFLMVDSQRRTLALLKSGALVRLDASGAQAGLILRTGFTDVTTVYPGARHILFGTLFGIARFRDKRLQIIDEARFPTFIAPSGIVEAQGETWMIGAGGIVGFSSAELDRAFADRKALLSPKILDFEDGLPNVYVRDGQRDAALGGDGRIWFATTGGVVWIDPARLVRNSFPPPVSIRALSIEGRRYRDPARMTLPKGTSRVTIEYAALSLAIPTRVRFRYRLEGVDEDWIDPGMRREANYANLGSGTYQFQVIAANNDGVWNREGATLAFTILPTFVQSVWFKLLAGICGIAVLAGLYLLRVRHVTAALQNRFDIRVAERERIARELHDTLLQGFQGLMLQIKAGVNRLPDPVARQPLDEALQRAQAVLIQGRDRVRDLRAPDSAGDLAQHLLDSASAIVGDAGPHVQVTAEGPPKEIHPVVLDEILRISEEAMHNIRQHANATAIEVLLMWDRGRLSLLLRDDGIGIPEEVLARGERLGHYGLRGMRERAERIGGRLVVTSQAGEGTEVALIVPGRVAYRNHVAQRFGVDAMVRRIRRLIRP